MTVPAVEEPLLESAPIAWRMAPQLCRNNPAGEDCSAMHGTWQYLRLLGLVGSISKRASFYHEALAALAGTAPRVLICGAADYAMLALVMTAFRGRSDKPNVTVLDQCDTPLMLNRWYANRALFQIETSRSDILDYPGHGQFDAVCTDSFLGQCRPEQRAALVAKWWELLRPGGIVVTSNRLRPTHIVGQVGFSDEQARMLSAAVLRGCGEMREAFGIDPNELAQRAYLYATRQVTYTVPSLDAVRNLFETCGFRMDHLSTATISADNQHGASGPSVLEYAESARIIACRP